MVLRVKHFISTGEACFLHRSHMELTDCDYALEHIRALLWVWLMEHSLVAVTCCSWLVCVDTGDNYNLILYLFLNASKI